jgi:hypothetical protein
MDNTLSDVNFGDDHSVLGTVIVAGATVGGIVLGWLVTKFCMNKKFEEKLSAYNERIAKLEGPARPQAVQPNVAPAKA